MLSEANILEIRIRMEALICRRAGMIAENAQRERMGYPILYGPVTFSNLEDEFTDLANTLVRLTEN